MHPKVQIKSYTAQGDRLLNHVLSIEHELHDCEYALLINYDSIVNIEVEQLKFIQVIKMNMHHVVTELLSQGFIPNLLTIMEEYIEHIENKLVASVHKR